MMERSFGKRIASMAESTTVERKRLNSTQFSKGKYLIVMNELGLSLIDMLFDAEVKRRAWASVIEVVHVMTELTPCTTTSRAKISSLPTPS